MNPSQIQGHHLTVYKSHGIIPLEPFQLTGDYLMKALRAAGFTLIELLTVIAIISILAGLTAVVLPGVLERAKVADAVSDMRAISTSLHAYFTEEGTYPPGYGYELFQESFLGPGPNYNHHPYTEEAEITGAIDAYDRFSENYDTNGDGTLQMLEYIPLAGGAFLNIAPDALPYQGGAAASSLAKGLRPYVYVPYAKKDIERMRRIIKGNDPQGRDEWLGTVWDANFVTENTLIPPAQYDAFVLLSVGPLQNTRGLLSPPGDENAWLTATGETMPEQAYYILAMRAAYLATRDGNGDGILDFDYRARTKQDQGKLYPDMPDGRNLGIAAPIITKSD